MSERIDKSANGDRARSVSDDTLPRVPFGKRQNAMLPLHCLRPLLATLFVWEVALAQGNPACAEYLF